MKIPVIKYTLALLFFVLMAEINISAQNLPVNVQQHSNSNQINCFVYHRFGDSRFPSTNISVENFRQHLEFLKENNFNVLTLSEALDLLDKNELPEKTVVLTVDDGYQSFFENAMPLLREFEFSATLFINTNQFGSGDFLSVQQIKELHEEGIEIGNHSHSHAHFTNFSPAERLDTFRRDLERSQKIFTQKLEIQPQLYAYPYGEYTPEMQEVLKESGYKGAAAQKSGVIASYSSRFALPRFPMAGIFTRTERFAEKAQMKAMPVKPVEKVSPLLSGNNPPLLELQVFNPEIINLRQLQFFVGGEQQENIRFNKNENSIEMQSVFPLTSRRTLYTVTAPSKTSPVKWFWYSFMWINSSVKE